MAPLLDALCIIRKKKKKNHLKQNFMLLLWILYWKFGKHGLNIFVVLFESSVLRGAHIN